MPFWFKIVRKNVGNPVNKLQPAGLLSPFTDYIHNSFMYRQVSNISRTLAGNKIVDNSDVVGASPVGADPTTSSLST